LAGCRFYILDFTFRNLNLQQIIIIAMQIKWGIIGCGDVTEVKSGPAFNKVSNSSLVAVMRRNAGKAQDYAKRHKVPKWYSDASKLINDPDVNAIYIATPPSSHEEYTIAALEAGKPVYVEKPMTVDGDSAARMTRMAADKKNKLVVAHYRRCFPLFRKIKQLIEEKAIGDVRFARIETYKKTITATEMADPGRAWRVDAAVAGGGLFHDLSPHQLDLIYYFFGEIESASGRAVSQTKVYEADDLVTGNILFKNGVVFDGLWCFNVAEELEKDSCEIIGSKGKVSFAFFENKPVQLTIDGKTESISFEPIQHVQQPMIQEIVDHFLGKGPNPCSGDDGVKIMRLIDAFVGKK
jgi:predicted dehydrogenase